MEKYYSRLNELNSKIDKVLHLITGDFNTNFTEQFTENHYKKLKNALSDVHNVLTLKLTFKFIELLKDFGLDESEIEKEKKKIDSISPNSKGVDVKIDQPIKVLAEIKCIIPDKKNRFNAAQRKNLFLDAIKLRYKNLGFDSSEYFKFLVIQDNGVETDEAIISFLNYKPTKLNSERQNREIILEDLVYLKDFENIKELEKSKIYIIKI